MRMLTRTFRLNPEYDKILSEEAEKHGLSVSALLNQMIRQYVLITRFTDKTPTISMSYNAFAPLLKVMSDKDLVEVGEKTGLIIPEEAMLQRGNKLTLEKVERLIDIVYGKYGNWFDSSLNIVNGKQRLHLSHQLNHKWSLYLEGFISCMFKSILDIEPKIETRENSVTLYIDLPRNPTGTKFLRKTK